MRYTVKGARHQKSYYNTDYNSTVPYYEIDMKSVLCIMCAGLFLFDTHLYSSTLDWGDVVCAEPDSSELRSGFSLSLLSTLLLSESAFYSPSADKIFSQGASPQPLRWVRWCDWAQFEISQSLKVTLSWEELFASTWANSWNSPMCVSWGRSKSIFIFVDLPCDLRIGPMLEECTH